MKILKIIFFLISFSSFAQNTESTQLVTQKAEPYEGMQQFRIDFSEKINLKKNKIDKDVRVVLKFIVEPDGAFSNITVLNDSLGVEKQLTEVLQKMPKWKPGIYEGKAVRSSFNLPVILKPEDNEFEKRLKLQKKIVAYKEQMKKMNKKQNILSLIVIVYYH